LAGSNAPRLWERTGVCALLLLLFGICARLPALQGTMLWDDEFLVRDNPFIKSPLLIFEAFRQHLFPGRRRVALPAAADCLLLSGLSSLEPERLRLPSLKHLLARRKRHLALPALPTATPANDRSLYRAPATFPLLVARRVWQQALR
jgi:hypothetical protein